MSGYPLIPKASYVSLVFLPLLLILLSGSAGAEQKKVFVVHSYHASMPWSRQCNQGLEEVLGGAASIRYFYLDTKRVPSSHFGHRAEGGMQLFEELQPDMVMLGDDNAMDLLSRPIVETGIPVVFFGINNSLRSYFPNIPENVTGVLERVPLFPWIRFLGEIMPDASRALVLMDESPTSKALLAVTFGRRKDVLVEGIRVEYRLARTWAQWKRTVLEAGEYDMVVMPVFHAVKDGTGSHQPIDVVIDWTSRHSVVPVFANQDYAVGNAGAVGAYVIRGEEHCRAAARLALGILDNKKPDIPLVNMDQKGRFFFNRKQLQRFGLTLPRAIEKQTTYR